LPIDVGAVVRGRIQERYKDADSFKGGEILFESVHGVDARKGVWRLVSDPLGVNSSDGFLDPADADFEAEEWKYKLHIHYRRERSKLLVKKFKDTLDKYECEACGFDFGKVYGELGRSFIEAHHKVPVAKLKNNQKTLISDLAALCSNCHRIIHRGADLSVTDLQELVEQNRKSGRGKRE
jgi:predicted HNH restriction endonuclease